MPRRKKHKKHGKNKQKKVQLGKKQPTPPSSKVDADCNDDNLQNNRSNIVEIDTNTEKRRDSFDMETPVKTKSLRDKQITQTLPKIDMFTVCTSVETPINKRRSLNNKENDTRNSGNWNVTNLNLLFDSNLEGNRSEVLSKEIDENREHSRSRIINLHSPEKEKPLLFDKGTQTLNEMDLDNKSLELITETPRINQKILKDIELNEMDVLSSQLNNIKNLTNPKPILLAEDFNINPYLKDRHSINLELKAQQSKWHKETSIEELSFFSPQLFDGKSSSTPIDKFHGSKLVNLLKENVMKDNLENLGGKFVSIDLDGTPLREMINATPRSEKIKDHILNNSFDLNVASRPSNVNLNTPPLTEKILNKDQTNSIKLLGSNKRRNIVASANKTHTRISPKLSRLVNHSRILNKNLSYSRLNASRKSLLDNSCELARSPSLRIGMYDKFVNKIKRYSKASAKWSVKVMEACSQLGIQIKNSFSSLCTVYNDNSFLEYSGQVCKCEEYKTEISNLTVKIDSLNNELVNVKKQIEVYHEEEQGQKKSIEKLQEELIKVKQELANFTELRTELTSLKEQLQCLKTAPPALIVTSAPPPPLAPPPPPPPPPPLPPMAASKPIPKLGLGKKAKSSLGLGGGSDKGENRPVISLDEILKVKLKKASDRPVVTPVSHKRQSTPAVPEELLRQVRLRPSSRTSLIKTPNRTTFSTPGMSSASSETSTSPHSSLCRILTGDPVWRVKRLRKMGGYSFDSVHRRSPGKVTSVPVICRRDRTGS